jgi:hypothetical protein
MPISGDCADATRANIHWKLGGDIVYQSGVFFIEHLEANMAMIAALGQIVGIEILNSDGQIIACCPDGYHFNPAHLTCEPDIVAPGPNPPDPNPTPIPPVPIPIPIPIPGPPVPIPIPEPQPPECGGDDCDWHQQIGYYLTIIVEILIKISNPPEPPEPVPNDECCLKLVAVVQSLQVALQNIATAIANAAGKPGTPPDLTPIVTALVGIRTDLDAIKTEMGDDTNALVGAIGSLIEAMPKPDPNLKRIADALEKIASDEDPQGVAIVRNLMSRGALSAELGNLIIGQG